MANSILFTWNPKKWEWEDLPQAVSEANLEGKHIDRWSCGVTRRIKPGDRAFLMRLGVQPKGIMGSGIVISEPKERIHWDSDRAAKGDSGFYLNILFDALADAPLIGEDVLSSPPLQEHNWFPQASGTFIPENIASKLESIWTKVTGTTFDFPSGEDLPKVYLEGTKRTKLITSSERNPEVRSRCIEHYGAQCQVCGMVFVERYGKIGKGFIHVHHIVQMSETKGEYAVDPIKDLRPLCPNCHAMIHKRLPPYTIEELTKMMKDSNKDVSKPQTPGQMTQPHF